MSGDVAAVPTVSIIVRTRNRPVMLAGALRDITEQDLADVEVIVVNDGDDGEVVEAAVTASELADRTRIVDRTSTAHGRARAANAGIRAARGEYLVLHDDDDTWATDFLSVAVEHLRRHPESRGVSAHTEVVVHRTDPATGDDRAERLALNPSMTVITIPDMVRENRITTNSLVYRAAVHEEIGYLDEDLLAHEDWDFYLRFIARYPIDLLPLPARAFWHHRPEATGDEGNSVFVLGADHEAGRLRVRDAHLRKSIARIGLGPALHLAAEAQTLQAELTLHREALAGVQERLDRLEREVSTVPATLEDIRASVERIEPFLLERTSVASLLRRVRRLFRP